MKIFLILISLLFTSIAFAQTAKADAITEYKQRQEKLQKDKEQTKESIKRNIQYQKKQQLKAQEAFEQNQLQAVDDYFTGKQQPIYDPKVIQMNSPKN